MSIRFRWLFGLLLALVSSVIVGCGRSSSNISSTHNMYVAATGSSQIWGFRANFFTGALGLINGTPFAFPAPGRSPGLIVVDASKSFAYVSGVVPPGQNAFTTFEIQTLSIDANGSLSPASQPPVVFNSPISSMSLDTSGKYLLVLTTPFQNEVGASFPSTLNVYSIASGSLTLIGTPTTVFDPFGSLPPVASALAEHSALNILYVADQSNGFVLAYTFDPSSGIVSVPAGLPPVAVGLAPSAISIDPTGRHMYVANHDSSDVTGFDIAQANQASPGSLTALSGSPFKVGAGGGPVALSVDPSGTFLYVVDHDTNQVWGFRIASGTGALTSILASPFSTGSGPIFLVFSPTNRYLYISDNLAGTVEAKGVDPTTGNLGPGVPVSSGINPDGIAIGQ